MTGTEASRSFSRRCECCREEARAFELVGYRGESRIIRARCLACADGKISEIPAARFGHWLAPVGLLTAALAAAASASESIGVWGRSLGTAGELLVATLIGGAIGLAGFWLSRRSWHEALIGLLSIAILGLAIPLGVGRSAGVSPWTMLLIAAPIAVLAVAGDRLRRPDAILSGEGLKA